jgi:RNA polymerase sigma-70 factor (ECF subfamily)
VVASEESMTDRSEGTKVEDLIRRARSGSSAAFGELVARYESPLFNFLLRRTASAEDAEEIAQDAFVRAWQRIESYDSRWSFSTWLFTLARRLAATRSRSARPAARGQEALDLVTAKDEPGGDLTRTEERETLWSTADRILDSDQRAALWLRYAEELTVGEIAEVLGRSPVSVRVMLYRARARLAARLAPGPSGPRAGSRTAQTTGLRKVGA